MEVADDLIGFIKNWAVNIVILVLFIVMTEMLLPSGRIKKYANLITGTVLIIAIIDPLMGLIGKNFDFSVSQTAAAMTMDKKEIEKAGKLLEEEQVKQTTELYRKKIIEQIEHHSREVEGVVDAKADVIINEDYESETFGEIKRIYVEAEIDRPGGQQPSSADIPAVEKVGMIRIGDREIREDQSTVDDSRLEAELADRIEYIFGVSRDNIIISQIQR
jgi:stage III sporulation protein AF